VNDLHQLLKAGDSFKITPGSRTEKGSRFKKEF